MILTSNTLARDLNIDAVIAGRARLSVDQAIRLYHEAPLHDLGRWASAVAERIHGPRTRTYVIDRNINYTNVCSANCTFCAFKRDLGEADAYTLSTQQLHQKVRELAAIGGTQILLQGGMHPELPIEFYEEMLRGLHSEFPKIHIHGFSPPEFVEFVAVFNIPGFPTTAPGQSHRIPHEQWLAKLEVILRRLMAAGLASIPGGGGEIFAEPVRRRIGLGKATAQQWLDIMAAGHRLGLFTSATMMFGHIEGIADRIDHMDRCRTAQDQAISQGWPGRYVSFIAWPFQRENTPLGRLKEWNGNEGDLSSGTASDRRESAVSSRDSRASKDTADSLRSLAVPPQDVFPGDALADLMRTGLTEQQAVADPRAALAGKRLRMAGAVEYLRVQAIARLFLDNFHSIGASWVTMGPKIGQLGLFFGASDMGSVMMEENVVSAAGTTYCLNEPVLCHLIRDAGFIPAQRDNRYNLLKVHDGPGAPDLSVTDWSKHRMKRLHQEHATAAEQPPTEGIHLPIAGDAKK